MRELKEMKVGRGRAHRQTDARPAAAGRTMLATLIMLSAALPPSVPFISHGYTRPDPIVRSSDTHSVVSVSPVRVQAVRPPARRGAAEPGMFG